MMNVYIYFLQINNREEDVELLKVESLVCKTNSNLSKP